MADVHAKHHDYHLVDPSPWPAVGSVAAFILAIGAIGFGASFALVAVFPLVAAAVVPVAFERSAAAAAAAAPTASARTPGG